MSRLALAFMIAYLKLDERLSVLRAEDHFRNLRALDDQRLCVICKRKFNGRQVEIRIVNRKYALHCPTEGCNSGPHLWIFDTTTLVSHVIKSNYWRSAGKAQERRAPALGAQGHRI